VTPPSEDTRALAARIRTYWNEHLHDHAVTRHAPGTPGFFADLDDYRYDKLHHLPRLVDFAGQRGRRVLDVGCGAGIDLVRFAKAGAHGVGIDVAPTAVALARTNLAQRRLPGHVLVADGDYLPFPGDSFDYVFAHGVVQYTADPQRLVDECRRVARPGGVVSFQVYNRISWLSAMSAVTKVDLEHVDAPVLRTYSHGEFGRLLTGFRDVRLVTERFPVKSRLHRGWKAALFNGVFVRAFNALPRRVTGRFGWHLIAFCTK
jgi:SAM-dependent methyltransferase